MTQVTNSLYTHYSDSVYNCMNATGLHLATAKVQLFIAESYNT